MKGYVIYHEFDGVYLGNCMGLGFWSKLDPVGQDSAPVFPTEEMADQHVKEMTKYTPHLWSCRVVPVEADTGGHCASIQACVKAGLPEWKPE